MNKSMTLSKVSDMVMTGRDQNIQINTSKKDSVVSKFFQQKPSIKSLSQHNMKNKNERDSMKAKLPQKRMICSEDVSRKKRIKINTSKFLPESSTLSNIENNDFLEKLKKNFNKDYPKQLNSESHQCRKLPSRPKTLFNDESLKLMSNFRKYIEKKDQISQENINLEFPQRTNSSILYNDTSSNKSLQNINYHNYQHILSKRKLIDTEVNTTIPMSPTSYSNQFLTFERSIPKLFESQYDLSRVRSISQEPIPDSLSFMTIVNIRNTKDRTIRYPTPPLNECSDI